MEEDKRNQELDPASQSLAEALNLSFAVLKGIMAVLVVLFLSSGIFTVNQDEVAMVLRFGKIQGDVSNRELKPGLHWTWPYPLSNVIKISSGREHTITVAKFWYYEKPDEPRGKSKIPESLDPEYDGYCLTGDANIIHSQWQIRYQITDAYAHYMNLKNPQDVLEQIVCDSIIKVTANFSAQDALRNRIDDLRLLVQSKAQEKLDRLNSGIRIQGVAIPRLIPPRQAQEAFEAVLRAKSESDKNIEIANNYKNQAINLAVGEKAQMIAKAKNYKLQMIKEAESDADYFEKLVQLHERYPDIFKRRHYQQIVEENIRKVQEIFLFGTRTKDRELRILLNRNPELYRFKAKEE